MYTYLIGWKEQDKWYYGVRLRYKGTPQDDLWTKYKTSSQYVKRFVDEFGDPDVVRVHKEFEFRKDVCDYEYKFLKRVNAKKNPRWLNQTIMGAPMGGTQAQIDAAKRPKSAETRRKIGEANRGNKRPDARLSMLKINAAGLNDRTGAKHSEETIMKIKAKRALQVMPKRGPMSEETKRKISEAKRKVDK